MKTKLLLTLAFLVCTLALRAQWVENNNGLYGGVITALVANGSNLFAGTNNGVFFSTNNGSSWTAVSTGLTNTSVQSLVVSGSNLFAGTNGGGVFLSADNGSSWTPVNTGLPANCSVESLLVSGSNLLAGTSGGVYLSTNSGTTWTALLPGLQTNSIAAIGGNLFAGTYGSGVYLSTNNGTSWTAVNSGLAYQFIYSLAVSGSSLFAGTNNGVYLSTNNGTSWTPVNTGLVANLYSTNTNVYSLAVSGSNLFAGTYGGGVFLSTNNGANWTAVNSGLTNNIVNSLLVSGGNLFAGTNNGVFLSTDSGGSWTSVTTGLANTNVFSLAVSGSTLIAGTNGSGVFQSNNNGTSWTGGDTGFLPNTAIESVTAMGSNLFAGVAQASESQGGVFRSTDNGVSWTAVNTGLTNINIFSLAVSGSNLFAGTYGGGVFLSTNNGANWTAVNTGLTNVNVQSLLVSGSNLFAGTGGGGVFVSTNNGSSWTAANTGLAYTFVQSLTASGSNLYAGTNGGVFLSMDNGLSWTATALNSYVQFLTASGSNLFASAGGLFLSTNNGATWTDITSGLQFLDTNNRCLIVSGGRLFAGTFDHGLWSRALSDFGQTPTITGFSPASGEVGAIVNITGTGFDGTTPTNNILTFNGTTAVVTASTTTSITTSVPTGATTGLIAVTVGGNTATSSSAFTVTANPVIAVNTQPSDFKACAGDVATFTTGGTGTTNITYQWQFSIDGVTFNDITNTGGYTNVTMGTLSVNTTSNFGGGFYRCRVNGDFATEVMSSDAALTINPVPSAPTSSNASTCGPGSVTFTASGGTNGYYIWYDASSTVIPGQSNASYTTPVLSSTTNYSVAVTNGTCTSALSPVVAIINTVPAAPTSSNVSNCGPGSVSLIASGGTNGNYIWYDASSIVIPGQSNSTYTTPVVSSTTNYSVAVTNGTCTSAQSPVVAIINTVPAAPTSSNVSNCGPGSVSLIASGGTNGNYIWYDASSTVIPGQSNGSYTTPVLSSSTNYSVAVTNGTCTSASSPVTAIINTVPTAPTTQGASACAGSTFTLNASGGSNGQYVWYSMATGGTAIPGATNSSYTTAALMATTTYYVSINNGTCESGRTPVTATISTAGCSPPVIATAPLATQIGGVITLDLVPLISTPSSTLDLTSLVIVSPPSSGAKASISATGVLTIDYSGIGFSGTENITVKACDTNGNCTTQQFSVEVAGDIVVYNAVSPNGKNPSFIIQYIDILPDTKNNSVYIFDRWENQVWHGSNYDNSSVVFSGVSDGGSDLPSGVYYYKIDFGGGRKTKTGFISLRRQ